MSTGYILGCKFRITAKAHSSSSNKSSLSSREVVHLSEAGQAIPEDLGGCSALLAEPPAPCRPVLHTPPGDPSNSTSAQSRPPVALLRRLGQALSGGRGCPQPCSVLGPATLVSPIPDALTSQPLHLYLSYCPSRSKSSPPPTDCPSVGDNVQHASHLISIYHFACKHMLGWKLLRLSDSIAFKQLSVLKLHWKCFQAKALPMPCTEDG